MPAIVPYSAAYMLDMFNRLSGRPGSDLILDATKYVWLSEAQNEVISEIATIAPWTLYQKTGYGSQPTMLTTDNQVFTFGVDVNGNPIMPFGAVELYKTLTAIPDMPMVEELDYLNEGTQIRIPGNRTYTGTLYWRGVVMPQPIGGQATPPVDPALNPRQANELIAIRAVENFAESGNLRNPALADRMRARWARRFPYWMLVFRKQFSSGGVVSSYSLTSLVFPLK